MSVVIATRDDEGYVHLASDSKASNGFTDSQLDICKINLTPDEDIIIGIVGNLSLFSLQYYPLLPPMKYRPQVLDEEYFLTVVRPRIIENILMVDMSADKKGFNGTLFIAYGKQLYEMDGQYSMYPIYQKSASIGSGDFHSSASIKILDVMNELTIREKLMSAISVTSQFVLSVGDNIYYMNTKDLDLMKLTREGNSTLILEPDEVDENGEEPYIIDDDSEMKDLAEDLTKDELKNSIKYLQRILSKKDNKQLNEGVDNEE